MRQLLPHDDTVDPLEAYLAAPRPTGRDRPWVTVGMISTLDGGTTTAGTSGGLGGPADAQMLRAVRGIADAVIVGAGTVTAEDYGPLRHSDEVRSARAAVGRSSEQPRLVIVSGRLSIDASARVFVDAPVPPLVCTTVGAPAEAVAALEGVAEVFQAGDDHVDLPAILARLRSDGASVVVSEGGPTLNGALVDAGVVDEWCMTIAPLVAGGDSHRIVHGAVPTTDDLEIASLLTEDGLLFGRWTRR
ncbi:dihydrofolate reductase family protein [Actinospongicola halichondriae]|uniref:dihydrofolate reductase family protein n=1 Tax=Actinospongicola halichondriae TaxID=3236844 RepID=UPI003D40974C